MVVVVNVLVVVIVVNIRAHHNNHSLQPSALALLRAWFLHPTA
jgi:hypothetical protein